MGILVLYAQKSEERDLEQSPELSLELTDDNTHNLIHKVIILKGFYSSQLP